MTSPEAALAAAIAHHRAGALDRAGSLDQALAAVAEDNRLPRQDLVRAGQGFSRDALRCHVDARIAAFTPAILAEASGGPDSRVLSA